MKKTALFITLLTLAMGAQSFASISKDMTESTEAADAFVAQMQDAETSVKTYREYRDAIVAGKAMPAWLLTALQTIVNSNDSTPFATNYASDMLKHLTGINCAAVTTADWAPSKRGGRKSAGFMEPASPRKGRVGHTAHFTGPTRSEQAQGSHFDSGSQSF